MKPWMQLAKHFKIIYKNLKISKLHQLCAVLFTTMGLLLPVRIAGECTPVRSDFQGYSFLDPKIINPDISSAPFFSGMQVIYDYFGGQTIAQQRDNLNEWQERFCRQASIEDIRAVIYDAKLPDLQQLFTELRAKSPRLSYPFTDNRFARYLKRNGCLETVEYLLFAKRCEPHVTTGDDPWKTPRRDTFAMRDLLEEGKQAFSRTQSHYIRLRYAYQIIRLAHYAKNYAEVLSLYDFLMPQIDNDPSTIEYWIEGHRAGTLMALGRQVEASYIFSKIFENCPAKAESALRSFRIRTDEEWAQCLLLCQSDRERATLYALRARSADSRAVEEMEAIYELDPRNHHLETLLIGELRKLEKDFLGLAFNSNREQNRRLGYPRAEAGRYAVRLLRFVRQAIDERQVARPALWIISKGYLELLMSNYYDARRTFRQAMDETKDPVLQNQLQAFDLALTISAYREISNEVEQEVSKLKSQPVYQKHPDFPAFLSDKMAMLYRNGNSPGKAYLTMYRLRDLRVNPQIEIIDDLLAICRKPIRNSLEIEMITKRDGSTIEKDLLHIKATLLLSQFQLEEALSVLKQLDRNQWDSFGRFNPFIDRFRECVHCATPETDSLYNKGQLIELLLRMEKQAMLGDSASAINFYDLGVAYYNMSYFSYGWKITDFYRSGASMAPANLRRGNSVVPHPLFPNGNRETFDCSRALYFFEKARVLSNNPELAARATYMAAKCERNDWYLNRVRGAPRTYQYFEILRNEYANTNFYNRVVRECKTFRAYVSR